MKLSELIRKRKVATATVATPATVSPVMRPSVANVASVAVANDETEAANDERINAAISSKPLSLIERQREVRLQKVMAMLKATPDTQRAIYTDTDSDPHNVILTIAVRACQQTCEMTIDKAKYDPWRLLELIERMGVQNVH